MITCTWCKTIKSEKHFAPNKAKRNGLSSWCNTCRAAKQRVPEYLQVLRKKKQPARIKQLRIRKLGLAIIDVFESQRPDYEDRAEAQQYLNTHSS